MAVTDAGDLVVRDIGLNRITIFPMDGSEPQSLGWRGGRPSYDREGVVVTEQGATYLGLNPAFPADGSPIQFPRPVFVRLLEDMTIGDTIYAPAS